MLDFDKVRECFFGRKYIGGTVVITPAKKIYDRLLDENRNETSDGWYKTAFLPELDTTVIKTHQGRSVVDVLQALPQGRTLHVGYCGSVSDFPIGDVVFASDASHIREPGNYPCGHEYAVNEKFGRILSVDSILLDELNLAGTNFVDMETYWVYRFSERPISILLVTDRPGKEPFYDVPMDDPRLIEGFDKLISTARSVLVS